MADVAVEDPITDESVVVACIISKGFRLRSSLAVLLEMTEQSEEVCLQSIERAVGRGLVESGGSLHWAWPTRLGYQMAEERMAGIRAAAGQEVSRG